LKIIFFPNEEKAKLVRGESKTKYFT